jgi:NAD-dependent oxidoreductase involved in siderophore biosynthesis
LTVEHITECVGPFDILTGKLGDTPITIEYNNQVNTDDRDNHAHLLHNFAIVYETGRLILEDTFGPVLWKPRMYVPKYLYNPEKRNEIPPYLKELTMETLGNYKAKDFMHVLFDDWKQGIADNIVEFSKMIDQKVKLAPYAQRELLCSQKWSEITNIFGFAKLIHPEGNEYIPSAQIHKYSEEV